MLGPLASSKLIVNLNISHMYSTAAALFWANQFIFQLHMTKHVILLQVSHWERS
uniref:Uncharacterized protein n=1 Tax=Rhizophora mucronata TaxID=61149 RepID=A0A2P2NQ93_RHIMU